MLSTHKLSCFSVVIDKCWNNAVLSIISNLKPEEILWSLCVWEEKEKDEIWKKNKKESKKQDEELY